MLSHSAGQVTEEETGLGLIQPDQLCVCVGVCPSVSTTIYGVYAHKPLGQVGLTLVRIIV